jgi:NADPH-dependent curcumin reductase CurA
MAEGRGRDGERGLDRMESYNERVVLAARPIGEPKLSDFRLERVPRPEPKEGEVLLQVIWLSIDPYMRGRMNEVRSYAPHVKLGEVMVGGTVGRVLVSRDDRFAAGDVVVGYGGWQEYAVLPADGLRKLDPARAPMQTALGSLGMPGMTAYVGLQNIGRPKPGETVVVGAASGAVGSMVGQLAKLGGCRVVGIAGGQAKCDYVKNELGFDEALDHREPGLDQRLATACPDGVDVYFENVGGAVWEAVFPLLNDFARIPVCGLVAGYNATKPPAGPDRTPQLFRAILVKHLTVRGFIVWDFADQEPDFLTEVGAMFEAGKIKYREDVVYGLKNAPQALIGLLSGRNFGKQLVRVHGDQE